MVQLRMRERGSNMPFLNQGTTVARELTRDEFVSLLLHSNYVQLTCLAIESCRSALGWIAARIELASINA